MAPAAKAVITPATANNAATASANTVAEAIAVMMKKATAAMMAPAAKRKKIAPREITPYPKNILGKRNALLAFGCSEHYLEPVLKEARHREDGGEPFLLRHARAEKIEMQKAHTALITELRNNLQNTLQKASMHVTRIERLSKDLREQQQTATNLRSELHTLQTNHNQEHTQLILKENELEALQNQLQMVSQALAAEQNAKERRDEENAALKQQTEMHQDQILRLQNQLEMINRSLTIEQKCNDQKSQEIAALIMQIQTQSDEDMDEANFHGQLQTPDNSEHDIMDDSQDSIQPQKQHEDGGAMQTNSEETAKLTEEVEVLRAELHKEQTQRKAAEEGKEYYQGLYNRAQQRLMRTMQQSAPQKSDTTGIVEGPDEYKPAAQADIDQVDQPDIDFEPGIGQLSDAKSLTFSKAISEHKNLMHNRSSKFEKSNGSSSKGISKTASSGNGINKTARLQDARRVQAPHASTTKTRTCGKTEQIGKLYAELAAEREAKAEAAHAKRKQEIDQSMEKLDEMHPYLHPYELRHAKQLFKDGKSLENVDWSIREGQKVRFQNTFKHYEDEEYHKIPERELIPDGNYANFYYYTVVGGQHRLYGVRPPDLNVGADIDHDTVMPILVPHVPYGELDIGMKFEYVQLAVLGKFPELLSDAAATVLPPLLLRRFNRRMFKSVPVSEPLEKTSSKYHWDELIDRLTKMNSFRRACEHYANGAKQRFRTEEFWPNNFDDLDARRDSNPYWDQADYPLHMIAQLEDTLGSITLA